MRMDKQTFRQNHHKNMLTKAYSKYYSSRWKEYDPNKRSEN